MTQIRNFNLNDVQPSQIYLNAAKIAQVKRGLMKSSSKNIKPVHVFSLNDGMVMIDGHTRAFVLYQLGFKELPILLESILPQEKLKFYALCVERCKKEHIFSIKDLKVVRNTEYKKLSLKWSQEIKAQFLNVP